MLKRDWILQWSHAELSLRYGINSSLLITYLLTPYSTVLLEKLTGSQLVKKFPAFYGTPKVRYRIHKYRLPVPILSQIDPVHALTSHFLKIHLNIILQSTSRSSKWSLSLRFPDQNTVYNSALPRTCYIPRPCHYSRFDNPNNHYWLYTLFILNSCRGSGG